MNPTQAMALWGTRTWATRDGVSKTFHDLGLVAEVTFRHHGWTPMEVEGLTLDGVSFRRRDSYKPLPLEEVPPRMFSEVMRDCDLVVSVAHRGRRRPEASASTVEMRSALLRETCSLLNINNCKIVSNHVLIEGKLGRYSVHLGSAVVHRQPGGALCILPVGAQHRGRLFLPFADDDPRSAEVISKVLLLARDHEIQDPSIPRAVTLMGTPFNQPMRIRSCSHAATNTIVGSARATTTKVKTSSKIRDTENDPIQMRFGMRLPLGQFLDRFGPIQRVGKAAVKARRSLQAQAHSDRRHPEKRANPNNLPFSLSGQVGSLAVYRGDGIVDSGWRNGSDSTHGFGWRGGTPEWHIAEIPLQYVGRQAGFLYRRQPCGSLTPR